MAHLFAGQSLPMNIPLRSPNGAYFLVLQVDGNLVGYTSCDFRKENAFWASNTAGKGAAPFRLDMQMDGNLVVYDRDSKPTWSSHTHGNKDSGQRDYLIIQDDRNVVVYRGADNNVRWASNTEFATHSIELRF